MRCTYDKGSIMMYLVQRLAEEKIKTAIDDGELDNLSCQGKPLELDDNKYVPMELRTAYRILKNSGYLPSEQSIRAEIKNAESLLQNMETEAEEKSMRQKLSLLNAQMEKSGFTNSLFVQEGIYREKLLKKLSQ